MDPPRINPPELFTRAHKRIPSLSPTRSPTRQRITDDILSDLSPATTLEAFTSPSGKLRASIEAATPSERAFGIRATLASKKIQEWVDELSAWPWPAGDGPAGFETPAAKRRRISVDERTPRLGNTNADAGEEEYIGSLPAEDVARYENRIDDIHEDMDDLNVEEIKSTVLNTHFSPKSRPSSSGSNAPVPSIFSSYTRMDDFTAVITATVLQALPNLSRLTRLMDIWTVRLLVLRKVPPLLLALDDAEVALKSGWQAIEVPGRRHNGTNGEGEDGVVERISFEIMRDVLQEKVTALGQNLDYMLDTLEGRQDTLPEIWLDRMESIERDYGEWVVRGDRKVREGEWARMAKARKAEADRLRAEEEAREAARVQAEKEQRDREKKLRLEQEEAVRLERERKEAEEKLRLEQEAAAEAARQAELARKQEEDRMLTEEAARQEVERLRLETEERVRLEQEAAAELVRRQEEDRIRSEEAARQEAERQIIEHRQQMRREQEVAAEAARKLEAKRIRAEAAHQEAERLRIQEEDRLRLEEEAAAEAARQAELAQKQREEALRLQEQQAADAEATRILEEKAQKEQAVEAELAQPQAFGGFQEPMTLSEQKAATVDHAALEPESDMIPPSTASALALGIGAAITTTILGSGNEEVAESQNHFLEQGPSYDAAHFISADGHQLATRYHTDVPIQSNESTVPCLKSSSDVALERHSPLSPISKFAPFDGSDETKSVDSEPAIIPESPLEHHAVDAQNSRDSLLSSLQRPTTSHRPQTPTSNFFSEKSSTPRTPSTPSWPLTPVVVASLSPARQTDSSLPEQKSSPNSPSRLARFGHGVANILRRKSSPTVFSNEPPHSFGPQPRSPSSPRPVSAVGSPRTPTQVLIPASPPSRPGQSLNLGGSPPLPLRSPAREHREHEWVVVDHSKEDELHRSQPPPESTGSSEIHDTSSLKAHNRNISLVSGYSTSDMTPEILEAEPTEYFRPVLSPIKIAPSPPRQALSPSKLPLVLTHDKSHEELTPTAPAELSMEGAADIYENPHIPASRSEGNSSSEMGSDGAQESVPRSSSPEEFELQDVAPPALARKTSIARIDSPIKRISIPRRQSTASDASTILHRQPGDAAASPVSPTSPLSELGAVEKFPDVDDESPLKGRARSQIDSPGDRSMSGSPPPIPSMSPRRSFQLPSPSLTKTDYEARDVPSTPNEAPVFDNIDLSEASIFSSPKKTTDDQIQAQISSLLESIPARIRLTSEPNATAFPLAHTLHPAKTRRSITPSLRSHSSLSMRAPTPSFTLAPAYGKGTSRPRHQNGNPEIKLYHLSRSTGEAPIKLFVRLVGENGERVMVRVGGGWADLGEYLREYASHHGRRSAIDSDKVEVQDIRPRVISTGSTASSSATVRGNGRSSPVSRPSSAFDRPMSSLHIRKTRRSIGETDSSAMTIRSPSTPMPTVNRGREFETPPPDRSSSRLSWTEEEGGLGLAGPKAKKVAISERDQEWVESMKEKVRLASAEKEKEKGREREKERERKSFGEMERVGGTKRLFRKTGG